MNEMPLYRIRDLALGSGRAVFSVQQLANLIGRSRSVTTVYMSRLVEKGMASRILRGIISFEDDDFIVATQLVEPSYVSLDSALLFHGVATQITKNVECVTSRNSIAYESLGIVYHKIPKSLFFGYKREGKGRSYVFVADPAKALIDGFYLHVYSKEELIGYAGTLDFNGIAESLKGFTGKGSKRLGRVIRSLTERSY